MEKRVKIPKLKGTFIKRQPSASIAAKKAIRAKEAKEVEDVKRAMIIKGQKTSQIIQDLLGDFNTLKKTDTTQYNRKNDIHPMDSAESVEFLGEKSNSGLFAFGSHSKKRPNNLVMGRLFDETIYDMYEFGIDYNYRSINEFKSGAKSLDGSRPMMMFNGQDFNNDGKPEYKRIANLFLDYFRANVVQYVNLAALDHVYVLTAVDNRILFRHYAVVFKRSGTKVPRVELEEMGPSFDMLLRRHKEPAKELENEALKIHKSVTGRKIKNVAGNEIGEVHGDIHLGRQDFNQIANKKVKGLKKSHSERRAANEANHINNAMSEFSQ